MNRYWASDFKACPGSPVRDTGGPLVVATGWGCWGTDDPWDPAHLLNKYGRLQQSRKLEMVPTEPYTRTDTKLQARWLP